VIDVPEGMKYEGNARIISPYPSHFELLQDGSNNVPKEPKFPLHAAGISFTSEWITGREKTGGGFVEEGPPVTLDRFSVQLTDIDYT